MVVWMAILIIFVVAYETNYQGKILEISEGQIESCYKYGFGRGLVTHHANIKLGDESRMKVFFKHCRRGNPVFVYKRRGLFYFNTVYTANY